MTAIAYAAFSPPAVFADHERLGKRLTLLPEQVAPLGSSPIERLRHEILYQHLRHQQSDEYCMADEMHGKKKTRQQSRDACDGENPSRDVIYVNYTDYFRENFNDDFLIVRAAPTRKIETLDGKVKKLQMAPDEPFPFALEISYRNPDSSQFWRIYDSGVKAEIVSPLEGPETSDKLTALLVDGRKVEYLLPVKDGFRLGSFTFKGDAVDQLGGSKNTVIRVSGLDENSLRLAFGTILMEFRFPFGISDSYLENKYLSDVRFERRDDWHRRLEGSLRVAQSDKKFEPRYSSGDSSGFSYGFHKNSRIAKVNEKVEQFHGRGRAITKAVYDHLIRNLTKRRSIR